MYDDGVGVLQDTKEAAKWYRLSADQGYSAAQINLGVALMNGLGLQQDKAEAIRWYSRAAEQNDGNGQYNLALAYARGYGVPQDYKEALKWYRLAAENGHASAQNNLGTLFTTGRGVAPNRIVAYAFFHLSATNDPTRDNKAAANRNGLAATMSEQAIESAQILSRELGKPGNLLKALDAFTPLRATEVPYPRQNGN